MARLRLAREQIKEIEQQRLLRLKAPAAAREGSYAAIRLIARVIGIGVETADMLVNEILSRGLRNGKAAARYAGLTGSPGESGRRRREKGLARAPAMRARAARDDPTGLALPQVPERQRPCSMVSHKL
jgi:transposase